jgi:DNA adenine methylase
MIKSPLSGWLGGKFQLSKRIVSMIPEHQCYIEPFTGAAWVYFRKEKSEVEVLNDINLEIVTLYRVIQHHLEEFLRYFKWCLVSRDEFERLLKVDASTLTDIQRSARFFYLQKSAFAGRVDHPSFGYATTRPPRLNLLRLEEDLSQAHLRLHNVYIENLNYSDLIRRYDRPHSFFYIDPPYFGCEDDYGKNIFARSDFEVLAAQLKGIEGKFLLSLNDVPEIRDIFADFIIETATVTYTCSKKHVKAGELLIRNYELEGK